MTKCKYKTKYGKCSKKKGLFSGSRKSYNPFKMWGAWVGVVVGLIYRIYIFSNRGIPCESGNVCSQDIFSKIIFGLQKAFQTSAIPLEIPNIYYTIFVIILGFFLGWGIHALIRRFKLK